MLPHCQYSMLFGGLVGESPSATSLHIFSLTHQRFINTQYVNFRTLSDFGSAPTCSPRRTSPRHHRTLQQPLQVELDRILVERRLTRIESTKDVTRLSGDPAGNLHQRKDKLLRLV